MDDLRVVMHERKETGVTQITVRFEFCVKRGPRIELRCIHEVKHCGKRYSKPFKIEKRREK